MHPADLSTIDPATLRRAAMTMLGVSDAPRNGTEARRLAAAEMLAAFRDLHAEWDDPDGDPWQVSQLEQALNLPISRAQQVSGHIALQVDWAGLIHLVPAPLARLGLYSHGIYPRSSRGMPVWADDRFHHLQEPAAWVSFRGWRWVGQQFERVAAV